MTINDKLKAAIKRQGFTISSVASKMRNERSGEIGISQPSMSDMLKGNIPFSRVEEIASIIGLSVIDIIQEDDDTCTQRIACPYCGKPIRLSLTAEKEEHRLRMPQPRKTVDIRLNTDDSEKYRYKHPHNQEERMAMLELQTLQGDDGMVSVRNIIDGMVDDGEFDRIEPIR